ncbi:hypothetical protein UFOVP1666_113 [uncultured Caudovirales phage]|uniref:Uncharacterized protein n=1 Tax=uncultured Caudovirales phage TaxID=2100421 RepID=A0A6J5PG57_9CAUD|nr:hypothetical protein UFOVP867_68 [uncultured Caudovirales phage]CAB4170869.1 hypothetical protein UFOVP913_130 [uncultured Caudovirales phage]CAB4177125.1 hypothetical protein UFOVP993_183 [uncultured Caudovirales phage]CAB4223070.1 hypothetical protein UFOVP1666_113 [uncultured Caudovirales phage]
MNDVLKWLATFVALTGAILTTLQMTPINLYVLNIASIIFLVWAVRINEKSIICVNIGMLAIYGFGVFI